MNYFKNLVGFFRKDKKTKEINKQNKTVLIEATNSALSRYSKTFKDLAKYDRREKIFD